MFAPRWLFALPLTVLVPAVLLLRSRLFVVLLAVAFVVGWPVMTFNVPWQRLTRPTPAGTPFRVMTLNMHYSQCDPKPLEDLVSGLEPDIVAIQEWQGWDRSALKTALGWHVHATPRLFLASRHPIERAIELGDNSMGEHASAGQYELHTPVGPVHIFSLHMATTRQGIADTLHENRRGPSEIRVNSARRWQQSVYIAKQAAECHGPVLVVGDFNTPPESMIFRRVWIGYNNAFSAGGWGWGYTFFGARTMVRIDHILAGEEWSCAACQVGPYVGSFHQPVIADLVCQ
jgi:endonuclease/exonuclease/phosphatase (EEP) superfamily protein YafD